MVNERDNNIQNLDSQSFTEKNYQKNKLNINQILDKSPKLLQKVQS